MGRAGAVARLPWTSGRSPSRRSRNRRVVRALRDQGRYGPGLRDVLPAFAGVMVAVCALAAGLAAGYRAAGIGVPVAEPLPDEDVPHPHPHRGDQGSPLRLVVHRGVFTARDLRWAHRERTIRLLDGSALRRWAAGARLNDLLSQER